MRMYFGFVILLALIPALSLAADFVSGTIKTSGTGEVMVMPDTAALSFSVRAEDKQLAPAREQAAQEANKVIEALKAAKVPGLSLATSSIYVTPLVKDTRQGGRVFPSPNVQPAQEVVGYQVTNTVSVKIEHEQDLAKAVSLVVDLVLTNGANTLSGPNFSRKDDQAARQQALAQATKSAITNAQTLAKAADVAIRGYRYIGMFPEQSPSPGPMVRQEAFAMRAAGAGGGAPSPVEVRPIPITATVYVTAVY